MDASSQYVNLSLLSIRNVIFPKLLAMLLKLRTHYPDVAVKMLHMDYTAKFRSYTFEKYCTASGISLTYSVPYEHSQNGLAEAYIKKLQMVAQPLLLHTSLPAIVCGHAILHAASLLRLRSTLLNTISSQELLTGQVPSVAHL